MVSIIGYIITKIVIPHDSTRLTRTTIGTVSLWQRSLCVTYIKIAFAIKGLGIVLTSAHVIDVILIDMHLVTVIHPCAGLRQITTVITLT